MDDDNFIDDIGVDFFERYGGDGGDCFLIYYFQV